MILDDLRWFLEFFLQHILNTYSWQSVLVLLKPWEGRHSQLHPSQCVGIVDDSPAGATAFLWQSWHHDLLQRHNGWTKLIKIDSKWINRFIYTYIYIFIRIHLYRFISPDSTRLVQEDLFTRPGATKTRGSEVPGLISPPHRWLVFVWLPHF